MVAVIAFVLGFGVGFIASEVDQQDRINADQDNKIQQIEIHKSK